MRFIKKVKRVIDWLPVIWGTREYDYGYLYRIMLKQLERMEEFFSSEDPLSVEATNVAEEIREAIRLLKRQRDTSPIYEEELKDFHEKWGETIMIFDDNVPDYLEEEYEEGTVFDREGKVMGSPLMFTYEKVDNIEDWEKAFIASSKAYRKAREKEEKEHRELWEFFRDRIKFWWD